MNKVQREAILLAENIISQSSKLKNNDVQIILAPPYPFLSGIADLLKGEPLFSTAAQNCASEESGAFTGEVSAAMIASSGAEWVIIGHSERRILFAEDHGLLAKKVALALNAGLKVIFCCGEQESDRAAGRQEAVVKGQLEDSLFPLTSTQMDNVVVAYEPVWAIGTGLTASPEQAQEMHEFIRKMIGDKYGASQAANTSILYGGSCNEKNAESLFKMKDIDGGLIGGASLDAEKFLKIAASFPNP